MQGTATLEVYAGQQIQLSGTGSLSISNAGAFMLGEATVAARGANAGTTVDLSGVGQLLVTASIPTTGMVWMPALQALGGDKAFAVGSAELPALFSSGEGGLYVPPTPTVGYGNLPSIVSSGVVTTTSFGTGDATLPALRSLGGDHDYGVSSDQYLQPLQSLGVYGAEFSASIISGPQPDSTMELVQDLVIVLTSEGTLAASFSPHLPGGYASQ